MNNKRVSDIKRSQKEALFLRTISNLFLQVTLDDALLRGFCINRVMLSPDKGHCYVFFATIGGVEEFNEKLNRLKLYKPSLRAALAKEINGRYTPEITFKFDAAQEKTNRVEELLEELKRKGDL
jgi:ribosome-binding factor A